MVKLDNFSEQEVDELGIKVGDKVRDICDDAAIKINKILNEYGMSAKIAIAFEQKPEANKASE